MRARPRSRPPRHSLSGQILTQKHLDVLLVDDPLAHGLTPGTFYIVCRIRRISFWDGGSSQILCTSSGDADGLAANTQRFLLLGVLEQLPKQGRATCKRLKRRPAPSARVGPSSRFASFPHPSAPPHPPHPRQEHDGSGIWYTEPRLFLSHDWTGMPTGT